MKNFKIVLLLLLFCSSVRAQKLVEKQFNYSGKGSVKLNIQIADSIKINTWNKNEVYLKASVSINENKDNEMYLINFEEGGKNVDVSAKFDSEKTKQRHKDTDNCCNYKTHISWDVFVPANATISVETIDGKVIITGKTAAIKAYSISGFIDLAFPAEDKADFKISTITGTIYSNIDMRADGKSRSGGSDISSAYNGGGKAVDLKTISGDIYLRKPE
jgi:hypothetical protein